jgi:hypothetical protein
MRRVNASTTQSTQGPGVDSFAARVVKYIPADVVAAWVTLTSIVVTQTVPGTPAASTTSSSSAAASTPDYPVLWILFVVFLVLTAIWTWKTTQVPNAPTAKTQIIVSTISFAVWVFGLGGPFTSLAFMKGRPYLGGVALLVWTLVAGQIVPPKSEAVQPPGGGNNP